MKPVLLMEGNGAHSRARATTLGLSTSSEVYAAAVHQCDPSIVLETVFAADADGGLPHGTSFADYAGLIVGGSSLHAYDEEFAVRNQIDMLRAAGAAGLPVLGSCWGLQIAAVAGGGQIARSPAGREIGVARKILKTPAGRDHRFLAGKADCYDALCIHYDEVVTLPSGSTVLASNRHSHVQAAIVPVGLSQVWAVQYHPEFDIGHVASLLRYYADAIMAEGFYTDDAARAAHQAVWDRAGHKPPPLDAAWQLGLDADILSPTTRLAEIEAWLLLVRA